MFDIGFLELILVSIVGLLVLGPERLPGAIRTVSLWVGKFRRSFNSIRAEIEREIKADEIRQELHNQAIMENLKEAEKELRQGLDVDLEGKLAETVGLADPAEEASQVEPEETGPAETSVDPASDESRRAEP